MNTSTWQVAADRNKGHLNHGVTVANGMIGLVSDARPFQVKDVILNGVYDLYQRGRVSNILKAFNQFDFRLFVDDQWLTEENTQNLEQVLDMKKALLQTTLSVGAKAEVTQEVMALRHLPYSALANFEVKAKEDFTFTFANSIEAPGHLQDVRQFFSQIDRPHVLIPLFTSVADSPSGKIRLAASNSIIFEEPHGQEPALIHEEWDQNSHLIKFKVNLKAGQTYRFSVVGSVCTSVHFSEPQNEAERLTLFCKLEGRDRLIERHRQAWDKLWEKDIVIEGDEDSQRDIRFMLYHLYAFVREGNALSLSPMGLSGLGYNGHVFWDTELWMYPALLMMNPALAKSLLDYRFERLEAAKQNAFSHGYQGAMFPWESAEDGFEQAPVWALTGPFQQHITACVGWAFWKYFQVTQDKSWLAEKGWPVLKEVATFWCDRVERKGPGSYEINNVIGANEFEENIDNNAFTNGIVKLVLEYTAQAAETLGHEVNSDWRHVAENIPILEFADGTTRENRTYDGAEIKQADANLLTYPLGMYTDPEKMRKDLDYYEPRMSPEGPAMGVCTLATIHALLGDKKEAFLLFQKSYLPNLIGPFGVMAECADGKGVAPFFITGAGGMLQTVLSGFGGLRITDEGLVEAGQCLPEHWTSLKIKGVEIRDFV